MKITNVPSSTTATWREQDALAAASLVRADGDAGVPADAAARVRVSDWLRVRLHTQAGVSSFAAEARAFHHVEAAVRPRPLFEPRPDAAWDW